VQNVRFWHKADISGLSSNRRFIRLDCQIRRTKVDDLLVSVLTIGATHGARRHREVPGVVLQSSLRSHLKMTPGLEPRSRLGMTALA
jgi:hypothetical protein